MRTSLSSKVQSGYRFIGDGKKYDACFPKPDKEDKIIIRDGEVEDTVELMKKVVHRYPEDTKKIAPLLKGKSIRETCKNIWQFVYGNIQYQFDQKGLEQLRRPARAWADRKSGVDCDCMSILVSSILYNLKLPHFFRITKYSRPSWQHVYVVVPGEGKGEEYIIDGVVSRFNYEKPYTAKKDFSMDLQGIDVAVLSGYEDENNELSEVLFGLDLAEDGEELGATDEATQLESVYRHLLSTRKAIAQNPNLVVGVEDPQAFLKMLDYAIKYWNTDKRSEALEILSRYENSLNLKNGFSGEEDDLDGYEDLDELGFIKPKKFFKNIGNAVKKVGKGVAKVGKGVVKGVVKVAKTVGKGILKFNPLSIAARAGLLLALKMNMKGMASKLKWGYASQQQASAKGIPASQWQKSKNALAKVESVFASKLQGSKNALRNAILKGKAGNLNGLVEYVEDYASFEGLGIAPAAALAAAVPVIKVVLGILKKDGLATDDNTDDLNKELDASAQGHMKEIESQDPQIKQVPESAVAQTGIVPYSASANLPATSPDSSSGGGLTKFIQANPLPSLLIGGVLAYGIYKVLAPKAEVNGLDGTDGLGGSRPRQSSSGRRPASRKTKTSTARKSPGTKKAVSRKSSPARRTSIRKVTLF